MRGHEAIEAIRRRGVKPGLVFVQIGSDRLRAWSDWPRYTSQAHVEVPDSDDIDLLDLRCIVGLFVLVAGLDETRVERFFRACCKADAKRVIATAYRTVRDDLEETKRFDSAPVET